MPDSKSQVRLAHAVLAGGAKGTGMSHSFAKEVVAKMHGKKFSSLPERAKAHSQPQQKGARR